MASRDQAAQPRWPSAPTAPPCCSRICRKASSAHSQRHEDPRPVGIRCVAGSCSAERPRRSVAVYIQRPGRPASADPHSLGTEMATSAEPTGARRGLPPVPVHGEPRLSFCWGHTGLPGERGCNAGPPTQQLPAPQQEARACAGSALHCSGSPHPPTFGSRSTLLVHPKGAVSPLVFPFHSHASTSPLVLLSSTGLAIVAGFGNQTQLLPTREKCPARSRHSECCLPSTRARSVLHSQRRAAGHPFVPWYSATRQRCRMPHQPNAIGCPDDGAGAIGSRVAGPGLTRHTVHHGPSADTCASTTGVGCGWADGAGSQTDSQRP